MAIPPDFLDDLKTRIPAPDVVGRKVRLIRSGRDLKGLCPFHKEKTPSFHCYDSHYHCFGCGAHGSIIDFVMETESLSFPEAVEKLAAQAGMAMPTERPEDQEKRERRRTLADATERAAQQFETWLHLPEGKAALEYLKGRGLTDETIKHFRLGFAPDNRGALKAALARDGIEESLLIEAGLVIRPDGDRTPYDRFRGRGMFPITDRQNRVIAFGARLLKGDGPKYLNSPETPLFHKGRNLYGLAQARDAIRGAGTVLVAEGYMDVIALAQGGFAHAVAPLGTAITEEQITELWRVAPEPVLCLDGDTAGQRAAARAAERALPILKAGYGLRFALMPPGEDPDSLIQSQGPGAIEQVIEKALPLSELIWRIETGGGDIPATPEGRAGLDKRLKTRLRQIQDSTVRDYFADAFKSRLWPNGGAGGGRGQNSAGPGHGKGWDGGGQRAGGRGGRGRRFEPTYPRLRAGSDEARPIDQKHAREAVLLATILNHPALADEVGETLGTLCFRDQSLDNLRQALLLALAGASDLDSQQLRDHLSAQGHEAALRFILGAQNQHARFAGPEAGIAEARRGWDETVSRLQNEDLAAELREAQEACRQDPGNEDHLRRVMRLSQMINEAEASAAAK